MFIELHKLEGFAITININKLDYFTLIGSGEHTMISIPNLSGLYVRESYEQVKELIEECLRR